MAIGVAELKRELKSRGGLTEFPEIHQFLDGFYLSRIGIRILIGQHIALHEPQKENHIGARRATSRQPRPPPELDRLPSRTVSSNAKHAPRAERRPSWAPRGRPRAGMICTRCSPLQVAQDAIFDARSICMREYATAPEVTVYGDPNFTFAYVPSHLHHMTFELVRDGWPGHPGRIGSTARNAAQLLFVLGVCRVNQVLSMATSWSAPSCRRQACAVGPSMPSTCSAGQDLEQGCAA